MRLELPFVLVVQLIVPAALVIGVILLYLHRFAESRRWLGVLLGACLLDQTSKLLVLHLVASGPYSSISLLGGWLSIRHDENTTVGFGSEFPLLFGNTVIFVLVLMWLQGRLRKIRYRMSPAVATGMAMVAGGLGAIMLERIRLGYVVDFLEFGPAANYTYNPADLTVIAGILLLAVRAGQLAIGKAQQFLRRGERETNELGRVPETCLTTNSETGAGKVWRHDVLVYSLSVILAVSVLSFCWGMEKWEPALGPLHRAAMQGDMDGVERQLAEGAGIDSIVNEISPLQAAILGEQTETVRLLLARGATANAEGVIESALRRGDPEIISMLLAGGADPNRFSARFRAPVFWASLYERDVEALQIMLRAGAQVNALDSKGWTALHFAVSRNLTDIAEVLLEAGAEVDAEDNAGATPLLVCGRAGEYGVEKDVVELLLSHGAQVNIRSANGHTPLIRAVMKRDYKRIGLLLAAGADVTMTGPQGRTALNLAVMKGDERAVEVLLQAGAREI